MSWFKVEGRAAPAVLGIIIGLAAALASLTPYVSLLEEKIGLGLLFAMRGEQAPPADVLIVDIDRESANQLALSGDPEQWPHHLHADLIRNLHAAGAELVGFNIFFSTSQPQDDADMAAAMKESGSVVLANYLRLKHLQGDAYVESLEEPPAPIAQSALATVPFLLAQGEETERFLTRYGENGEHPTFPLDLLRLHVWKKLGGPLQTLLAESQILSPQAKPLTSRPASSQADFFAELEGTIKQDPAIKARLLRQLRESPLPRTELAPLLSLIESLSGENTRYFNHYGAAGTIPQIPYHRLVGAEGAHPPGNLQGKIVLVGFDENFQADNTETPFYSPFSAVSSLQLAATAVANLLNHDDLHPLFDRWSQFAWILVWGGLLGQLSSRRLGVGISAITLLSLGYLGTAWWLFKSQAIWLPLILPLFSLAPIGMLGCLLNNYLVRSREHKKIHSVISRFIPEEATKRSDHPEDEAAWESKLSFGVCLATDAGQYTSLAEKMQPMELGELMNDYYTSLFPAVRSNGGWVSDVTGDAMMAIWTVPTANADIRIGAMQAALDILQAVDVFQGRYKIKLPIRMGLHCGEMRVGFVGGKEHGAYRGVGDTVNTSARLEGLNKLLGTRILVSDALIQGLAGFITRPLGSFMLAGKSHPVFVHELLAPAKASTPELTAMIQRFQAALALFQAAQWQEAAELFESLADDFPGDGPSQFFSKTARANANNPQATADLASIPVSKPAPGVFASR